MFSEGHLSNRKLFTGEMQQSSDWVVDSYHHIVTDLASKVRQLGSIMQSHDDDMVLLKAIDDDHVVRVSGDYGGLKCDLFIYESVDLGFAAIPWLSKDLGRFVGNVY